ncbi:MAG: hypothetical protein K2N67_03585 [Mucispirillum sp.]|nr:hypothetical protein [Mucispirillum sp.]
MRKADGGLFLLAITSEISYYNGNVTVIKMNKILFFILSAISVLLAACDDSVYESVSDTNTKAAKTDAIDFAFIKGNCSKVVEYYENMIAAGAVLDSRQLYLYNNSVMACSGFDIINGIDLLLNSSGSNDVYGIVSGLIGANTLNYGSIENLKLSYEKTLSNCTGDLDADMVTVCGMAAAVDSILDVAAIAMGITGANEIELTEQGLADAISGVDEITLQQGVENYINGQGGDNFLNDFNTKLDLIEGASSSIGSSLGDDSFTSDLGELTRELRDGSGQVTSESLSDYINSKFNN